MEAPITLKCDVGNMFKIGNMRHGEYMNVGLGKSVIEIFAYKPMGVNDLAYDYQITRAGEVVELTHRVTNVLLQDVCANLIMENFE